MFEDCEALTSIYLSNFNAINASDISYMFSGCKSLNNIKFSNFNASKIESFSGMFEECENLTSIDLSNFNTINASDMSYMFRGCKSLNNIKFSNFNTSLRTIRGMFNGCASLISIDLYNLNLPNNKDTPEIRESNTLFQLFVNVANWKTCGIDIDDVFMGCESLKCLYCLQSAFVSSTYSMYKPPFA